MFEVVDLLLFFLWWLGVLNIVISRAACNAVYELSNRLRKVSKDVTVVVTCFVIAVILSIKFLYRVPLLLLPFCMSVGVFGFMLLVEVLNIFMRRKPLFTEPIEIHVALAAPAPRAQPRRPLAAAEDDTKDSIIDDLREENKRLLLIEEKYNKQATTIKSVERRILKEMHTHVREFNNMFKAFGYRDLVRELQTRFPVEGHAFATNPKNPKQFLLNMYQPKESDDFEVGIQHRCLVLMIENM